MFSVNAQLCFDEGKFYLQVETDEKERFKQIENAASAVVDHKEVVPVVHGRWYWAEQGEEDYEQYWICSSCGYHQYFETPYCPNCGAKMGEEEK